MRTATSPTLPVSRSRTTRPRTAPAMEVSLSTARRSLRDRIVCSREERSSATADRVAPSPSRTGSWWVLWSTSRPTILATRSKTISPMRAEASALARRGDLALGVGHDALVLRLTAPPRLGLHLVGDGLGGLDDLAGLLARVVQHAGALVVARGGLGARGVGGLERGADLRLAALEHRVDPRDEVLGGDEHDHRQHEQLHHEGAVGQEEDGFGDHVVGPSLTSGW